MIAENPLPTPTTENAATADTPAAQKKISAYYSLVFPHFTFYIQTLSVTIGRRCSPNAHATTSSAPPADATQVDVDLGALKSVSRLHAKIEYDSDQDRFVLAVIGRNGAWVDGVWSGSGTRAALGERSQIQIASRTFEFVLPPPPPPPDESPSPGSSSANRQRSPSLDITSFSPPSSQPSHSPPPPMDIKPTLMLPTPPRPIKRKLAPAPSEPQLPNSNSISRSTRKKDIKSDSVELPPFAPPPEDTFAPIPPPPPVPDQIYAKPTYTYAQLIYRAMKVLHKATLNEICNWIMTEFPYFRSNDNSAAWMSSVRHNLSSNRAFKKLEKCGDIRGKGNFWSLDEDNAYIIEEQELKAQQAAAASASKSKKKDKDKNGAHSESPFKRSAKGDAKGILPPPLTSKPLPMPPKPSALSSLPSQTPIMTTTPTAPPAPSVTSTSVFSYHASHQSTTGPSSYSGAPMSGPNPYASLTQPTWRAHTQVSPIPVISSTPAPVSPPPATTPAPVIAPPAPIPAPTPAPIHTSPPPAAATPSNPPAAPPTTAPVPQSDVPIPIILGPIPPTHPDYSPTHPNNSAREGYMVLHERKLVLDPSVFNDLTKEIIADLERMGARKALDVLTGHMVRVLKERRRATRKKGGGRGRGAKSNGGVKRKEPGDAPSTSAPLAPAANPAAGPAPMDEDAIVIIDDSDDGGPVAKKRKIDEPTAHAAPVAAVS